MRKIYCAGEESAQDHRHQHPVLECDICGKRKEIKPDVLAVEGIALSVRHLVDEPENQVPVSSLTCGDQNPKDDGDPGDEQTPWSPTDTRLTTSGKVSGSVSRPPRIPGRRVRE